MSIEEPPYVPRLSHEALQQVVEGLNQRDDFPNREHVLGFHATPYYSYEFEEMEIVVFVLCDETIGDRRTFTPSQFFEIEDHLRAAFLRSGYDEPLLCRYVPKSAFDRGDVA